MKHLLILITVYCSLITAQAQVLVGVKLGVPAAFDTLYKSIDSVRLPEGFSMSVFHAGMKKPRFFAWSPAGVLHVADINARTIVALPDTNNDGVADTAFVAASPVDSAHSIAFYRNALYVAEPRQVWKFTDTDGDGVYETRTPFISGIDATGPYNHYTRTILIDSVGGHIYIGVGASCNACRETNPERAAILRFNLDGSGRMVFATGFRNPLGLAIEPATGKLWTTNADRDWLGDEIPPEMITSVDSSGFYGFPFAYGNRQWVDFAAQVAPEYPAMLPITAQDSALVSRMKIADATITAHTTPMGIAFCTDTAFPQYCRGGAFVAVHGPSSSNSRKYATGYNVVLLHRDSLTGTWRTTPFIEGFLTDTVNYKFWGRPCGVGIRNGVLYVGTDLGIGAIYRITYTPKPAGVREKDPTPDKPIELNLTER